jgi:hypothetical protein
LSKSKEWGNKKLGRHSRFDWSCSLRFPPIVIESSVNSKPLDP